MTPKKEDRRAPDQDAAIEVAFVAGVLPEEDRRAVELAAEGPSGLAEAIPDGGYEAHVEDEPAPVIPSDAEVMASAGVGSIFEKVPHGWKVRYVDGGAVIFCEGPSLGEALRSHGQMVTHA